MTIDFAYPLYGASGRPELEDVTNFPADPENLDDVAEHAAWAAMAPDTVFVKADILSKSSEAYQVVLWHEMPSAGGHSYVRRDTVDVYATDIDKAWERHSSGGPSNTHTSTSSKHHWPAVLDAAEHKWNTEHPRRANTSPDASRTESKMMTYTGSRNAVELHGRTHEPEQLAKQISKALREHKPVTMVGATKESQNYRTVLSVKLNHGSPNVQFFDPAAKETEKAVRSVALEKLMADHHGVTFEVHEQPKKFLTTERSGAEPSVLKSMRIDLF